MTEHDDDRMTLTLFTSNALLNEMDRAAGPDSSTVLGLALQAGWRSAGEALDRDFYAQQLAASLGSAPDRVEHAKGRVRTSPREPSGEDLASYAKTVGVDPNDQAAVGTAWATGWAEMVDSLCARAVYLIEATDGPVEEADPLRVIGLAEDDAESS